MCLQMVAVISRKSITCDEVVMIPSAYYHLAAGNFQLVNEHPPLSKILAAIPLLFVQPTEVEPQSIGAETSSPSVKWAYQESFWHDNPSIFESISFWARVPMIALTLALGVLIFFFARELFGTRAALFAVALFTLEPTVLAHGRIVQTDIPATFGYLLVFFMLYRYLNMPTYKRASWVGIAAGLALLAKFSMLLVGPILALFFLGLLWWAPRKEWRRATLAGHAVL